MNSKLALVTGAEGFIGSHLVQALVADGYRVRATVLYNFSNSWGWLEWLNEDEMKSVEIVLGDVRDPSFMREVMKGVHAVYHLAALISIPFSYEAPDLYVDTNIKGTLNVLNGAKAAGAERVIITSTSEVYGTAQYIPIDEIHPRQPQSPYSATKIGADSLADSYYRTFDLPVTIVRPFNTYGPRQSARAIIPTIITQLLSGSNEIKLGDLRPTRDFVFVKDTAKGFIKIAACDSLIGHDCNIATESEISMQELADTIIRHINPTACIVQQKERMRPDKSEVFRLFGSAQKLAEHTNWKPNTSLDEGIQETINWFRNPEIMSLYKPNLYNR